MCFGKNWHQQGDYYAILEEMENEFIEPNNEKKDIEAKDALHNLRHFITQHLGELRPVCFYATRASYDEAGNYDEDYTEVRRNIQLYIRSNTSLSF